MARHEADREDLISEATALVQRAEIVYRDAENRTATVVVGFRRDGSLSSYFGAEPVYQFNAQHQLRRAYLDGRLLKAERGQLVAMRRERTDGEVQLVTSNLSEQAKADLLQALESSLRHLAAAVADGTAEIRRQVPAADDPQAAGLRQRIAAELLRAAATGEVAQRPNL